MVTDPGNRFVFHSGAHKMNCCNLNAGLHTHRSTGNLKKNFAAVFHTYCFDSFSGWHYKHKNTVVIWVIHAYSSTIESICKIFQILGTQNYIIEIFSAGEFFFVKIAIHTLAQSEY